MPIEPTLRELLLAVRDAALVMQTAIDAVQQGMAAEPTVSEPEEPRTPWRTAKQAAAYVGLSTARLETLRRESPRNPKFNRQGRRVRYLVDDLDAWLISKGRKS